jgi:hypothetical protein
MAVKHKEIESFPETIYVQEISLGNEKPEFGVFLDAEAEEDDLMAIYELKRVVRVRKRVTTILEDVPNVLEA